MISVLLGLSPGTLTLGKTVCHVVSCTMERLTWQGADISDQLAVRTWSMPTAICVNLEVHLLRLPN